MNHSIEQKFSLATVSVLCALLFSSTAFATEKHKHSEPVTPQPQTEHDHDHEHPTQEPSTHEHTNAAPEHAAHGQGEDEHSHEAQEQAHDEGITFSQQKMALANIKVTTLTPKVFTKTVYAPGEIKANGYTSYIVSPRTESVVISRHATLGEHVEKGQALVTLFSEAVAQAQAQFRVAYSEWKRAKKLGKASVSESLLVKSETDYTAAIGRLTAFGLTKQAINNIVANNSSSLGEYTLVAQRSGAVLSDDFSQGQRVSAGEQIMILADEKNLWVEARLSPNKQLKLPIGTPANIELSGQHYQAKVIQEAHTIDPITRTRIVRLAVENKEDHLHSGMFVNVNFQFNTQQKIIAVPETALIRSSDGDWTVFVEDHPGEFKAVEITLGESLGDFRQIIGLAPDTRVVSQGAFFVASEIAKGGFDPHNH